MIQRAAICASALAASVATVQVSAQAQAQDRIRDRIEGQPVALDGDTLRFGALKVSLNGIDAPELTQTCRDEEAQRYPCGRAARAFMDGLLADQTVSCRLFGRTPPPLNTAIGICETADGDLSEAMVAAGWALPYAQAGVALQGAVAQAQDESLGLFVGEFQLPAAWRRGYGLQRSGAGQGDCVIKGNIGPDGPRYFTLADPDYERVVIVRSDGERWFCSVDAAIAAGWTRPGPRCAIRGVVEPDGRRVYYRPTDRFYDQAQVVEADGGRIFCSAGEAYKAGFRNCLIKGIVEDGGQRVYYQPEAIDYRAKVVERARGDRWLCTLQMARRAGFRNAAPLDPAVTRRPQQRG